MTLAERYDIEINEYVAQLEQLLYLFAEEIEEQPNAGMAKDLVEILNAYREVIQQGQRKRLDFGRTLREMNL